MPKFLTYKRPTSVGKQGWNNAPDRNSDVPHKPLRSARMEKPPVSPFAFPPLSRKK
jgi:hypothetical protein